MNSHIAYIGIGSNLGDRQGYCAKAVDQMNAHPEISVIKQSSWIETKPVGFTDQPDFINGVVEIETELSPHDLLEALQKIEECLGRKRTIKWGPRTIDLDILLYDDIELTDPKLTIPHPRMRNREFVMESLREIESKL